MNQWILPIALAALLLIAGAFAFVSAQNNQASTEAREVKTSCGMAGCKCDAGCGCMADSGSCGCNRDLK